MKNLLLGASLALLLVGCDNMNKKDMPPATPPHKDAPARDRAPGDMDRRSADRITPEDQSESAADRTLTQNIRQQLVKNDRLSTSAKNVKIITQNGNVVLNGEVVSEDEKMWIDRAAKSTNGVKSVVNNLRVNP